MGNYGWSYEEVLPYFIKSEDNRNPYISGNEYHGTGGLLTIQEAPYRTPLAAAFIQAGVELGRLPYLFYINIYLSRHKMQIGKEEDAFRERLKKKSPSIGSFILSKRYCKLN